MGVVFLALLLQLLTSNRKTSFTSNCPLLTDCVCSRSISRCIGAVKNLVNFFNSSTKATAELRRRQGPDNPDNETGNLSLEGYNRTRWDSVYLMISRVHRLRWTIRAVLSNSDIVTRGRSSELNLKEEQWDLLAQLVSFYIPRVVQTFFTCFLTYVFFK